MQRRTPATSAQRNPRQMPQKRRDLCREQSVQTFPEEGMKTLKSQGFENLVPNVANIRLCRSLGNSTRFPDQEREPESS